MPLPLSSSFIKRGSSRTPSECNVFEGIQTYDWSIIGTREGFSAETLRTQVRPQLWMVHPTMEHKRSVDEEASLPTPPPYWKSCPLCGGDPHRELLPRQQRLALDRGRCPPSFRECPPSVVPCKLCGTDLFRQDRANNVTCFCTKGAHHCLNCGKHLVAKTNKYGIFEHFSLYDWTNGKLRPSWGRCADSISWSDQGMVEK